MNFSSYEDLKRIIKHYVDKFKDYFAKRSIYRDDSIVNTSAQNLVLHNKYQLDDATIDQNNFRGFVVGANTLNKNGNSSNYTNHFYLLGVNEIEGSKWGLPESTIAIGENNKIVNGYDNNIIVGYTNELSASLSKHVNQGNIAMNPINGDNNIIIGNDNKIKATETYACSDGIVIGSENNIENKMCDILRKYYDNTSINLIGFQNNCTSDETCKYFGASNLIGYKNKIENSAMSNCYGISNQILGSYIPNNDTLSLVGNLGNSLFGSSNISDQSSTSAIFGTDNSIESAIKNVVFGKANTVNNEKSKNEMKNILFGYDNSVYNNPKKIKNITEYDKCLLYGYHNYSSSSKNIYMFGNNNFTSESDGCLLYGDNCSIYSLTPATLNPTAIKNSMLFGKNLTCSYDNQFIFGSNNDNKDDSILEFGYFKVDKIEPSHRYYEIPQENVTYHAITYSQEYHYDTDIDPSAYYEYFYINIDFPEHDECIDGDVITLDLSNIPQCHSSTYIINYNGKQETKVYQNKTDSGYAFFDPMQAVKTDFEYYSVIVIQGWDKLPVSGFLRKKYEPHETEQETIIEQNVNPFRIDKNLDTFFLGNVYSKNTINIITSTNKTKISTTSKEISAVTYNTTSEYENNISINTTIPLTSTANGTVTVCYYLNNTLLDSFDYRVSTGNNTITTTNNTLLSNGDNVFEIRLKSTSCTATIASNKIKSNIIGNIKMKEEGE